jgi:hypothetical protein
MSDARATSNATGKTNHHWVLNIVQIKLAAHAETRCGDASPKEARLDGDIGMGHWAGRRRWVQPERTYNQRGQHGRLPSCPKSTWGAPRQRERPTYTSIKGAPFIGTSRVGPVTCYRPGRSTPVGTEHRCSSPATTASISITKTIGHKGTLSQGRPVTTAPYL